MNFMSLWFFLVIYSAIVAYKNLLFDLVYWTSSLRRGLSKPSGGPKANHHPDKCS